MHSVSLCGQVRGILLPDEISGDELSKDVLGRLKESTTDSMLIVEESRHAFEKYRNSTVCYMHPYAHSLTHMFIHAYGHTQSTHMHICTQMCTYTSVLEITVSHLSFSDQFPKFAKFPIHFQWTAV